MILALHNTADLLVGSVLAHFCLKLGYALKVSCSTTIIIIIAVILS